MANIEQKVDEETDDSGELTPEEKAFRAKMKTKAEADMIRDKMDLVLDEIGTDISDKTPEKDIYHIYVNGNMHIMRQIMLEVLDSKNRTVLVPSSILRRIIYTGEKVDYADVGKKDAKNGAGLFYEDKGSSATAYRPSSLAACKEQLEQAYEIARQKRQTKEQQEAKIKAAEKKANARAEFKARWG